MCPVWNLRGYMSNTNQDFRQNAANVPKSLKAVIYTQHADETSFDVRLKQFLLFVCCCFFN